MNDKIHTRFNRPQDIEKFIQVIEHSAIEEEYIDTGRSSHNRYEKNMQQGMQAGLSKAKGKYAKEMLSAGVDIAIVRKVTQLTDDELDALD